MSYGTLRSALLHCLRNVDRQFFTKCKYLHSLPKSKFLSKSKFWSKANFLLKSNFCQNQNFCQNRNVCEDRTFCQKRNVLIYNIVLYLITFNLKKLFFSTLLNRKVFVGRY